MEALGFDDFDGLFMQPSGAFGGPVGDELLLQELFKTDFDLELEPLAALPPCTGPMRSASPATSASEASHVAPCPPPFLALQQPVLLVKQAAARGPGTRRAAVLPPPSQPVVPVPPTSCAESEPPRIVTTAPPPTVTPILMATCKRAKITPQPVEIPKAAVPVPPAAVTSASPSGSGSVSPACSTPSPVVPPQAPCATTSAPAVKAIATCAASAKPVVKAAAVVVAPGNSATRHHSEDMDTDSEDSNDTEEDGMQMDHSAGPKINKRKAPEVDWRAIEDPAERRRQRRLAKNRVTAARSRERKKAQWSDMEAKLNGLEADNQQLRAMLEAMTRENAGLREQLDRLVTGRSGAPATTPASQGKDGTSNESAALVFIAILLLLVSSSLPGEQAAAAGAAAMALGGAAPLLLLAQLLEEQQPTAAAAASTEEGRAAKRAKPDPTSPTSSSLSPSSGACHLWPRLLAFLAAVKGLLARAPRGLAKAVHRALYARHNFMPRAALRAAAAASSAAVEGLGASFSSLPRRVVRIKAEALVC